MGLATYIQAFIALIFTLSMIGILFFLIKKFNILQKFNTQNKLFCIESVMHIDSKRKLISVKSDHKRYILLLGNNDILIDTQNEKKNK